MMKRCRFTKKRKH